MKTKLSQAGGRSCEVNSVCFPSTEEVELDGRSLDLSLS